MKEDTFKEALITKNEVYIRSILIENYVKFFGSLKNTPVEHITKGTDYLVSIILENKIIVDILLANYKAALHSINVAIFVYFYGKQENFKEPFIKKMLYAALIHDVGRTFVGDDYPFMNINEEYDEGEREFLYAHTILGYEFIKKLDISPELKDVVLTHHERKDGSGFPTGKTDVNYLSQIIGLVDLFELTLYIYKDFKKSLKNIEELVDKGKFEKCYFTSFKKSISVFF